MTLLNVILQGIMLGGLYALYAAGLALIFGVMRLVNLAHGDFIVLGAFVILALATSIGLPLPLALLVALPFMADAMHSHMMRISSRIIGG